MSYTKYHTSWQATDQLTGKAWNHIETQWDSITSDADAHNHDTRYYTKTLSDAIFFSTSFYTGFDADLLDGQHFSDLVAAVMPLGAIMVWSGTDATIPTGWHICDGGTYGGKVSPDLRDRFVVGAGGSYAVGDTAGPAMWNGTITPTGSVAVGDHQLSTAELPVHNHTFTEQINSKSIGAAYNEYGNYTFYNVTASASTTIDAQASGDGTHGHTGSTISFTGVDPRPKWYSSYYIMKYA